MPGKADSNILCAVTTPSSSVYMLKIRFCIQRDRSKFLEVRCLCWCSFAPQDWPKLEVWYCGGSSTRSSFCTVRRERGESTRWWDMGPVGFPHRHCWENPLVPAHLFQHDTGLLWTHLGLMAQIRWWVGTRQGNFATNFSGKQIEVLSFYAFICSD